MDWGLIIAFIACGILPGICMLTRPVYWSRFMQFWNRGTPGAYIQRFNPELVRQSPNLRRQIRTTGALMLLFSILVLFSRT